MSREEELDEQISEARTRAGDLLSKIESLQRWRFRFFLVGPLLIAVGLLPNIARYTLIKDSPPITSLQKVVDAWDGKAGIFIGGLGVVGALLTITAMILNEDALRVRYSKALLDVESFNALKSLSTIDIYLDALFSASWSQVSQYYQFVLINVSRSSRIAAIMMIAGIGLIGYGITAGTSGSGELSLRTTVPIITGALMEIITYCVTTFHGGNVALMNDYMLKLEAFSENLLALSLLDTERDEPTKRAMRNLWFQGLIRKFSGKNGATTMMPTQPSKVPVPTQAKATIPGKATVSPAPK